MASLKTIYNGLDDVYDVNERVKAQPKVIDDLANLLVTAGLNKSYDIRLIHNHFNIGDGEQVVAFDGAGAKVSVVCKDGRPPFDLLEQHGVEPTANAVFTPTDFLINERAEAIPYEFSASVPNSAPALGKEFLSTWNSILDQYGLAGVLGLAVQDGMPLGGHEMSDGAQRFNKLSFVGEIPPEDSLGFATTSWRIPDPKEGLLQVMKCTYCTVTTTRHTCS